tara:strand:+ start:527 stop:652 length:126 start_codon:yes stop_codon:yes gene_type:complete
VVLVVEVILQTEVVEQDVLLLVEQILVEAVVVVLIPLMDVV